MKVFPPNENMDEPQRNFNLIIRETRQIVERVIGVLKGRFRCISSERPLRYKPIKVGRIIYTCAVLHNFLLTRNYDVMRNIDFVADAHDEQIPIPNELNANAYLRMGNERRNEVVEYLAHMM